MNILITGRQVSSGATSRGSWSAGARPAPDAAAVFGTSFPQAPPAGAANVFYLDLRAECDVRDLVRRVRPDRVFHLAAVSNVRSSWQARRETLETNVLGTHNLLEAVRLEAPRARVLFISSSDVYGVAGEGEAPLAEDRPLRVTNPYAYSKAAGEMMCGFYERIEGLDIVIARPFPHTGPGQAPDFVCADWARQIVRIERGEAEPILRVGNLDVRRDFSDVRDVVEAYAALMRKGRRGEVYNVCSGKALALREVLDFLLGEARTGLGRGPVHPRRGRSRQAPEDRCPLPHRRQPQDRRRHRLVPPYLHRPDPEGPAHRGSDSIRGQVSIFKLLAPQELEN